MMVASDFVNGPVTRPADISLAIYCSMMSGCKEVVGMLGGIKEEDKGGGLPIGEP